MEDNNKLTSTGVSTLISDVRSIVETGLQEAYHNVNTIAVHTYWLVGKRIVEEEQKGSKRAEYGKQLIKSLSEVLSAEYGNSFNEKNLRAFRALFLMFNDLEIWNTRVPNLTWSHIPLWQKTTSCLQRNTSPISPQRNS